MKVTVETVEVFVFWAPGICRPAPARMYALPLCSKSLKNHPIMKCLRSANIIIVDDKTRLPKNRRFEFCTFLVLGNPAVRRSGKIPIVASGFCSNLVAKRLRKDTRVHRLLNFRNISIRRTDQKAIRIISKLLTPRTHLYRVTSKDKCGYLVRDTLLNFAIDRKCFALCEIILQSLVPVDDQVFSAKLGSHSALTRAIQTGSVEMIQLLLDHGADGTKDSVRSAVAESGDLCLMRLFLEPGTEVDDSDLRTGNTALHDARQPGLAKLLIACGADVDKRNDMHETPLHAAIMRDDAAVVRVLLENNANIEALFKTDFDGYSPFLPETEWPSFYSNAVAAAVCLNTSTIFEMLIKFGAASAFENFFHFPSCKSDLTNDKLSENLARFCDFIFPDFKDSFRWDLVQEGSGWFRDKFSAMVRYKDYLTSERYSGLKAIFGHVFYQIIKVDALYLESRGPTLPSRLRAGTIKMAGVKEVKILKQKNVPGTSTSLHDIITGDSSFVSRLFRDESAASALNDDTLYDDVTFYRGVLKRRLSRGSWRRQVVNDGLKLLSYLFPHFISLPVPVRERIVDLLTNQEILVVEACFSRKQLKTIVGLPNCQTLLDDL